MINFQSCQAKYDALKFFDYFYLKIKFGYC